MPRINVEQPISPLDLVISRFPTRIENVMELYSKNPTFREICVDYAELVTWLENYCQSENEPSGSLYHTLELLRDLETEITDFLGNRRASGAMEHHNGTD